MAAEKQVSSERVAGKKRSRNKFKQNVCNTAAQPSAAAQQHFPNNGTSAEAGSSAVAMAPQLPEAQVGPSGRNIAGAPAMNGTAEMPPSKKHKKNNFKQHVQQEAAVAMQTSPVAAETEVHASNGATSAPAVVDGNASSHAAAKKRSKNKFKQHRESDTAGQTRLGPAVLDLSSKSAASTDAAVAAAAPAGVASGQSAARKRSKNKFKPQGNSPALPQTTLTAEGLHSTAAARGNGITSGQAGARTNLQPLQLCNEQASCGVPARGPTGQAGQCSGQPGALDVKVGAADRGQPSRDCPVDGHIRHSGPASEGVPAVSQKRHAGGRSGGPEAGGPMKQRTADQTAAQMRGPGAAVLTHDPAGKSRKKRRRKSKGAVALPESGPSADGGAHPGMGEGGPAKSVQLLTVVAPPPKGAPGSTNWTALKAVIGAGSGRKRKRTGPAAEGGNTAAQERRPERMSDMEGLTPVLAVDCEMVGVGADGTRSSLARVCVVNSAGNVLLDEHVAQKERVTDYRTRFSGIRPRDLVGAPSLEDVQQRVADMFMGRVVVGHAITNDLTALLLSHPRKMVRDTARYPPLMRATAPGRRPKPRALRQLALEHLGLTIQEGEHSPVDDARAALYLYQKHRKEWEMHIERGTISQLKAPDGGQQQPGRKKGAKTLEELAAADDMVDL